MKGLAARSLGCLVEVTNGPAGENKEVRIETLYTNIYLCICYFNRVANGCAQKLDREGNP
jgi:hypothetical protein